MLKANLSENRIVGPAGLPGDAPTHIASLIPLRISHEPVSGFGWLQRRLEENLMSKRHPGEHTYFKGH